MANPPVTVYRDFADASENPITNLTGVATLTGGDSYLLTGTTTYLFGPSQGRTSTGAQADGPSASTSVARTTGGLVEDGVYDTRWTFWNGAESLAGDTSTVTVATSGADTGSIVHTLPPFPQEAIWAYGYRQKDASGHFYRFATVDDLTQTTFIDTQIESAISGNPEPATSAPPAGRLTFLLTAPDDISDPSNGAAIISYTIVIGDKTYYTTTFAYSGAPIELGTVLSAPPSLGILTRIYWDDAFASEAPLVGKQASWRINQDCFATDTGRALFASQATLSLPADSLGQGEIWLKPQLRTTTGAAGFYYAQLIVNESKVWAVSVPLPDSVTGGTMHPNGFAFSELSPLLVGPPGVAVATLAQVLAGLPLDDTTFIDPILSGNTALDELNDILYQIRTDKGSATWKDARATLTTTGAIAGGTTITATGVIGTTGAYTRAQHLAGYPGSQQVTLSSPLTAAGSGATLTTIVPTTIMAGDLNANNLILHTGTGPTNGHLFDITFKLAYTNIPTYDPVPGDEATAVLGLQFKNITTTGMEVWCRVTPDASTDYTLGWIGVGR